MKINLCKDSDIVCENLDFILDDAAVSMVERLHKLTGKTHEQILEDCLTQVFEEMQSKQELME